MKITEISVDCEDFFFDGDFFSFENYVLIKDEEQVIRNGNVLKIKGSYSLGFPKVKIISSDRFILVDAEGPFYQEKNIPNAWIINNDGDMEHSFFIGSVNRLAITDKFIIASYHDSASGDGEEYANNQIMIFDHTGKKIIGYRDAENIKNKVKFQQNYAFYKESNQSIYFLPFPQFSIIEFRLADFSSKTVFSLPKDKSKIPESFWNPKAFSRKGENWYFLSTDARLGISRIFQINPNKQVKEIEQFNYSSNPKGLKGGQFFIPFYRGNKTKKRCQFIEI